VATTPAAIPESGRVGAKSDTLELPESLHSISEYEPRAEGTRSHGTAPLRDGKLFRLLACMFGTVFARAMARVLWTQARAALCPAEAPEGGGVSWHSTLCMQG
jgi:hypothetical protein